MKLAIYVLIFLAALLCVEGIYVLYRDAKARSTQRLRSRLAPVEEKSPDRVEILRKVKLRKFSILSLIPNLDDWPGAKRVSSLLLTANARIELDQFLFYSALSGLVAGLAAGLWFRSIGLGALGAAIGLTSPLLLLIRKNRRRQGAVEAQFPEILDLITRSLRVGHALTGTFKVVADEFPEPLGPEFGRVYEEHNLGISLRDSLDGMQRRLGNLDVRFFVTSVNIQRETGGNLAEILENLGRTIRNRVRLRGQVRAKTSEGRTAGWVLAAMPVGVMIFISMFNREYVSILFNDPRGQTMLKVAIALIVTGMILIRKIVSVKV